MGDTMKYVGIFNDEYGGMTDMGRIIRDAWVFEILPETETCEGWDRSRFDLLYSKVYEAWEPYGHMVSHLPAERRARHEQIHADAVRRARELGWSAELDDEDDE